MAGKARGANIKCLTFSAWKNIHGAQRTEDAEQVPWRHCLALLKTVCRIVGGLHRTMLGESIGRKIRIAVLLGTGRNLRPVLDFGEKLTAPVQLDIAKCDFKFASVAIVVF